VILALKALEKDLKLSLSAVVKLYSIPYTTLYDRRAGRPIRRDTLANSCSLTDLEEQIIVQYVIELSICVFPPRLCSMEDIAN
jgi:hypothetical protein